MTPAELQARAVPGVTGDSLDQEVVSAREPPLYKPQEGLSIN